MASMTLEASSARLVVGLVPNKRVYNSDFHELTASSFEMISGRRIWPVLQVGAEYWSGLNGSGIDANFRS